MADQSSHASHQILPLNGVEDVSKPLKGFIICCTSIPDEKRTELAQYAASMGAVHRFDLTLDVTHLIVGDYDTPKYQYVARERPDVQPMTVGWIEAIRELWMNDREIDIAALEREHRLPTFHSLRFSMTGCDDPTERLEIADLVRANGAIYEGDLTKQITHLISFRTEGAKYKAAKSWGLRIVSIEWLRDSLERGMILDEKLYDPSLPIEERGKGAWDRSKPKRTSLGKRSRGGSTASLEGGKRKLRRTASTKLSSQHEGLWGDIMVGGMVAQVSRSGQWEVQGEQDIKQASIPKAKEAQKSTSSVPPPAEPEPCQATGMFSGCCFYLHAFPQAKSEILQNHVVANGGVVSSTIEDLGEISKENAPFRLFRIIPQDLPLSQLPDLPESQLPIETITFWWVERCLHHKRFIDPNEHVVGRPFPKFPIEGFSEVVISSSGFSGIDLLHMTRSVGLIGAKYSEDMTQQSSVLITKTADSIRLDKFDHAREWNIPIVSADWLWNSITEGEKLPLNQYRRRQQKHPGYPDANKPVKKATKTLNESVFKGELPKAHLKTASLSSSNNKPTRTSGIDYTAFDDEESPVVKKESQTHAEPAGCDSVATTQELSGRTEPLSEINPNSPTRTVSTAPAPSNHPVPRLQEDMSDAISDLLAKTKTVSHPIQSDIPESRRRGGNRILGRAISNISAASTNHSRATSVDSTVTNGNPVQYPSNPGNKTKTANEHIAALLDADRGDERELESQPPATQLQYDDPESEAAREMVMARMKGEKLDPKRLGLKAKAATIGDFTDKPRPTRRRGRALK